MTSSRCSVEFHDSINVENVILDEQKKERSPFVVKLCCFEKKTTRRRAFLILPLHYLIIFVVLFIGHLALSLQTNYHSGVLALLSVRMGYINPGPKA